MRKPHKPGAAKAAGWLIAGVSNHGGVALGHVSIEDFAISELPAEKRAKVDEAYAAIKAIEERFPDGEAMVALALRAAEIVRD